MTAFSGEVHSLSDHLALGHAAVAWSEDDVMGAVAESVDHPGYWHCAVVRGSSVDFMRRPIGRRWVVEAVQRLDPHRKLRDWHRDNGGTAIALLLSSQPKPATAAQADDLYFIQCGDGDGPIKIGRATCVQSRLANLQTACPFPLRVLAVRSGEGHREADYHRKHQDHRIHGEWFKPTISVLASVHGAGL